MFWRPAFGGPRFFKFDVAPVFGISNCQGNFVLRIHRLSGGVPEGGKNMQRAVKNGGRCRIWIGLKASL